MPALAAQGQGLPAKLAQASLPHSQHSELSEAETELRVGTSLTREGKFAEAIPHLTAARGLATSEYAVSFNLALCFLGLRQYQQAIDVLQGLRTKNSTAQVENLLAQAYIGVDQPAVEMERAGETLEHLRRALGEAAAPKLHTFAGGFNDART